MNIPLKVALVERGTPAYKTAIEIGIHPNKLSKFISGLAEPTPEDVSGDPVAVDVGLVQDYVVGHGWSSLSWSRVISQAVSHWEVVAVSGASPDLVVAHARGWRRLPACRIITS